ncbi:MAG: efflux RND transporter periplasmic adaptor subunit [Bacteroidia bacterium]|nr:efflux RND transporter periplasmic adaptor subunit [Bacteroidia bacterium]
MRSAIVSLVLFLLIVAGGIGISSRVSSQKQPAPKLPAIASVTQVSYLPVKNGTYPANVEVNGRLVARDKVEIFSEVGGTYRSGGKPFKEGVYFNKGQVLINMADREFAMNLRAQKSSLMNQITVLLPDLKSDYPESFPRWIAYLDSIDLDKALPEMPTPATDKERYFLTAKNIYNLFYSIRSQEARQAKYFIYAPFSGKVSQSNITEGTLVRVGQKLGEFFNTNSYEVEASVSLRDLPYLAIGSQVDLRSDDIGGKWSGKVLRISDVIDPQTQTIRVFIGVSGNGLKEGMYLNGTVAGAALKDVFAIDRKLLMDDNSVFVAMPSDAATSSSDSEKFLQGATLKQVSVEPIQYSDDIVLVRGLQDRAWLVNQAIPNAYDGMSVSVFEAE